MVTKCHPIILNFLKRTFKDKEMYFIIIIILLYIFVLFQLFLLNVERGDLAFVKRVVSALGKKKTIFDINSIHPTPSTRNGGVCQCRLCEVARFTPVGTPSPSKVKPHPIGRPPAAHGSASSHRFPGIIPKSQVHIIGI